MLEINKSLSREGGDVYITANMPMSTVRAQVAADLADYRGDILEHAIDRHGLAQVIIRARLAGSLYAYRVKVSAQMFNHTDELAGLLAAGFKDEVSGLSERISGSDTWLAILDEAYPERALEPAYTATDQPASSR
jgi:hypothetical protein